MYRGMAALFRADLPTALDLHEQAVTLLSATPQPELDLRLALLISLGSAAVMKGDLQQAGTCFHDVLAITEPRGEIYYRSLALWHVARIALHQGQLGQATVGARESLRLRRAHGSLDRYNIAGSLEELAWIAASQRQHRRAATALGAADALWNDLGVPVAAALIGDHDTCLRQTRESLEDAAFTAALDHGQSLPFEAALDYALDERHQHTAPPPKDTSTQLTRRERQIADLVSQGMSNKEIAGTLVISQRTAESHVEHILTKLGFTSRAQVAAWLAEQRTDTSNA
jgi:DNA-binding NarL/FixJ family response regulator